MLVCQNQPETPTQHIVREPLLVTLDDLLEGSALNAVVEGPEGRGKSVLLHQCAARHVNRAVAVFISGTSRWTYDAPNIRFEICNQLSHILRGHELAGPNEATDTLLGILLFEARRAVRKSGTPFLFVIDGICEIPQEDDGSKRQILSLLPIGETSFRCVFSGSLGAIPLTAKQRARTGTLLVSVFSLDETIRFLEGLPLTRKQVETIHDETRGAPTVLAVVRRQLERGEPGDAVIRELPSFLSEVFQWEWRQVQIDHELQRESLAILAHDQRAYSPSSLAALLKVEPAAVRQALQPLSFLSLGAEDDGEARFVSDAFKRFAADRLASRRGAVSDILIDALLQNRDSDETRSLLPRYLRDAGKLDELVDFVGVDHIAGLVMRSPSLATVQSHVDMGMTAARDRGRHMDLVRLALQKATVSEFDDAEVGRSEIRALSALGEHELALAIAQGAHRHEDRLLLLASLARSRREAELPIPAGVEEQIVQLHETADFSVLGDRAELLAGDLVYSRPDLARATVERSSSARAPASSDLRDWRYAKLAFEARIAERESGRSAEEVSRIFALIENPQAKRLAAEAAIAYGRLTAAEAILEAARLEKPEDQVYVLRQWMLANRTRSDAWQVLEHALTQSIKATDYTLNAQHLRELVVCLPHVTDESVVSGLIDRIDGQAPVVREIGPTEEFVRVHLILARAEYRYAKDAARNRLVELYLGISEIPEFHTRVAATARFVAAITALDPSRELDDAEGLHGMAERELSDSIGVLLTSTADHYEATREIIDALAVHRPDLAMDVAGQLNTEPRRDAAHRDLAVSALRAATADVAPATVLSALKAIRSEDVRDEALSEIAHALLGRDVDANLLVQLEPALWRMQKLADPEARALALASTFVALRKHESEATVNLLSATLDQLPAAWERIDEVWARVSVGFELAALLRNSSEELARSFVQRASEERDQAALYSEASAASAIWCVRLAVRAFAGLLPQRLPTPQERERLDRAIDRIASGADRADLWADLAERYYLARQEFECREIVDDRIRPVLTDLEKSAPARYVAATARCGAAMYVAHRATAMVTFRGLPSDWKDQALSNVAEFIKRKTALSDPYDTRGHDGYELTYGDAVDLCELMGDMESDNLIYYLTEDVIDSLAQARSPLSRPQKSEIGRRLAEVERTKFPNPRFITHKGWNIALRAQLSRVVPIGKSEWAAILGDARMLANVADRAYVLAIAASCMKDAAERGAALAEVDTAIASIPVLVDQIEHFRSTGALLVGVDRNASKEYLRRGLQHSLRGSGHLVARSRRQIVDAAYRLDPEFASKLASDMDDDPAKDRVRRQIAIHDLRKNMAQERPAAKLKELADTDVAHAAWGRLGSLTSGRADHVPMELAIRYVEVASRQPLTRAYPIFALLIENACRRFAKSDTARSNISPLYEAAILGAELAIHASARARSEMRAGLESVRDRVAGQVTLIDVGQRDRGIEVLRDWIRANAAGYIKIADPYFTPSDLDLLRVVREVAAPCKLSILTSRAIHSERQVPQPWDEAYEAAWSATCDDRAPETHIVIVGSRAKNASPIHDRWWLTRGAGLELGTSWNGLGLEKVSSIRVMDPDEAAMKEGLLDEFLLDKKTERAGVHYRYVTALLGAVDADDPPAA